MEFPNIDPVAVDLGFFQVRWYALAYIAGLWLGLSYMKRLLTRQTKPVTRDQLDDLFVWVVLGVIVGGRLGFVLLYEPSQYLADPIRILYVWEGGMAFHGGLLGVTAAMLIFARNNALNPFLISDLVSAAAPIGVFFGRIANFINGELWGRASDVPWAMVFPNPAAGGVPRHPSQLYEALLEGVLLFILLRIAIVRGALARRGMVTGLFVAGYGLARFTVEFWREPGADFTYFGWLTHGQILCIPMLIVGGAFIAYALRRPPTPASAQPA